MKMDRRLLKDQNFSWEKVQQWQSPAQRYLRHFNVQVRWSFLIRYGEIFVTPKNGPDPVEQIICFNIFFSPESVPKQIKIIVRRYKLKRSVGKKCRPYFFCVPQKSDLVLCKNEVILARLSLMILWTMKPNNNYYQKPLSTKSVVEGFK